MQLSRDDVIIAAETAGLSEDDYSIREDYDGREGSGAGVVLPGNTTVVEFMVALAVHLAAVGEAGDAQNLARLTSTDGLGFETIVYWPGVEITD